jgi:hypothetical protein
VKQLRTAKKSLSWSGETDDFSPGDAIAASVLLKHPVSLRPRTGNRAGDWDSRDRDSRDRDSRVWDRMANTGCTGRETRDERENI